jgi:glutathione S-transferase
MTGPAVAGADRPGDVAELPRGSAGQRLRALLLEAGSWLACRLPDGAAYGLADLAGAVWYRVAPARAARARRNLARVAAYLAEVGSRSAPPPRIRPRWSAWSGLRSGRALGTTSRLPACPW